MSEAAEVRFSAYVAGLASVIGHADRVGPLRDYCTGLMLPVERKSVEPLAAVTSPARVSAQHQSLMHFVSESAWSDAAVLAKVGELVLPAMEAHGPIEAWIIDDTAFRKQGRHSVGVARQYCGEIGKQDNCQAAVSLSLANAWASLPVAFRLYLPREWADDDERRREAKVPADVVFATKPQIALEQITPGHEPHPDTPGPRADVANGTWSRSGTSPAACRPGRGARSPGGRARPRPCRDGSLGRACARPTDTAICRIGPPNGS